LSTSNDWTLSYCSSKDTLSASCLSILKIYSFKEAYILFNSVGISEPEFLSKCVYSWDNNKGEIAQKTETVKRYSDVLENPLHDLDDQIKEIEYLV
jgi:hypothetical protein